MPTEDREPTPAKDEPPKRQAEPPLEADELEQVKGGATRYPDGPQYDR